MAHRQIVTGAHRRRMRNNDAKQFQAYIPADLHQAIKDAAKAEAKALGGQPNMNRQIIQTLFPAYKHLLTAEQIRAVEDFLRLL